MPADLDAQRRAVVADRQFTICGQTFTIRKRVPPEVVQRLAAMRTTNVENADFEAIIASVDQIILTMLVKGDRDRWTDLRQSDDDDDALEFDDLQTVMAWGMERLSSRPLDSADSSQPTMPTTEPVSTPPASPLVAVPSTG